jgi:prolyl oligopeptidase PreP (S9A serine peptidase family)
VCSRLSFWKRTVDGWSEEARAKDGGGGTTVPAGEGVGVSAVWPSSSDKLWVQRSGFLAPASLELASAADGCSHSERLKQLPSFFPADELACSQHFATSADGTKVPYFQIGPKKLTLDGSHPTLLDGYGGFEVRPTPQTPHPAPRTAHPAPRTPHRAPRTPHS